VADQYLTTAEIEGLGSDYTDAVAALDGVDFDTLNEQATALIQSAMRNSGYSPAVSSDGSSTDIEPIVKLATLGAFRELLASIPEGSIPLPEAWDTNPQKVAYAQMISGEIALAATPNQIGAVGGMMFTSSDPDVDGSIPRKASSDELSGY